MLLIDEVDRADDEFEAFLLEVLSEYSVSIPELGTIRAEAPPVVVLTSNRTRELHDALKRRCFYHWLAHPSVEREVAILRARLPEVTERLARQVAVAAAALRDAGLVKAPGVAESLDWAHALLVLGRGRARSGVGGHHPGRGAEVPRGPGPRGGDWTGGPCSPVSEPSAIRLVAIAGFGRVLRAAGIGADGGPDRRVHRCAGLARRLSARGRLLGRAAHALRRPGRPAPLRRRLRGRLRRRGRRRCAADARRARAGAPSR